ncbi:hypothetical protein ACFOLK_16520 [Marinococcus halophilus]|uniref:hypothetical protein n=1 Tax=Marinococcus halophilus TaxID=1371 RepID=UPI003623F187
MSGKRSSQTITDAKWFQSKDLFGALPKLDKLQFERITASLYHRGWIEPGGVPAESISASMRPWEKLVEEAGFDGWAYRDTGHQFWKRIALLIQTLSHLYQRKKTICSNHSGPCVSAMGKTETFVVGRRKIYCHEKTV